MYHLNFKALILKKIKKQYLFFTLLQSVFDVEMSGMIRERWWDVPDVMYGMYGEWCIAFNISTNNNQNVMKYVSFQF